MSTTGFTTFDQAFTFSLDRYDRENPANKLSQTQLASRLGVTKATISNWKLGRSLPNDRELVIKLATILKLNHDETEGFLRLCNYPLLSGSEEDRWGGVFDQRQNNHQMTGQWLYLTIAPVSLCKGKCCSMICSECFS
jgi:transcriptional regulator with XRE-family HTH domain